MSPRESFDVKGRRYLVEGRLDVRHVVGDVVVAQCRGDSAEIYRLGYGPGGWWCDCPAKGRCSHLQALMLVVLRPGAQAGVSRRRDTLREASA